MAKMSFSSKNTGFLESLQLLFFITMFYIFSSVSALNCTFLEALNGIRMPGHIMIGGIFPIHTKVENKSDEQPTDLHCSEFNVQFFIRSLAMIHSIEMVNRSPDLPNITLGYEIYDTCSDSTMAIKTIMRMMSDKSNGEANCIPLKCNYMTYNSNIKAVIGEASSEISKAVAHLLSVPLMPQVSYSATSVVLSDKSIYPSFLRTTPSDLHQTNAMAKLASTLHWASIGAIGSNDEYGYYGTEEFIVQAAKYNLCISFKKIIQALMFRKDVCGDICLFEILKVINQSAAEAVIVFTKEANVKRILEGAILYNISQTWIATDTWSTSVLIAGLPGIERIGRILGFVQNRQAVPYFREYVRDLSKQNVSKNCFFNQYLKNYPPCGYNAVSDVSLSGQCRWNDSFDTKKNNCTPSDFLESNIDEDSSFSIYLAVNAISRALVPICKNNNCSIADFPSWRLLQELKRVNFSLKNVDVRFDKNGDFLLGYDIIGWKLTSPAQFETIGIYKTSGEIVVYNESQWTSKNITVTANMCYKVCKPGQKLTTTDRTCCFECTACLAGYYSSGGYETECKQCKEDEYSLNQSGSCIPREIDFLRWNDTFAAILITLNSTGMALIILFILVFSFHFNTPVITCAGGPLCFVMLASLLASFFSVFTFVGQPTTLSCQIQQPLFAVSFTLCIACTIAVIVQIFIAFTFDIEMNCKLQKFNKPVLITIGCTTLQAVLCVLRIKLEKLDAIRDSRTFQEKILYECKAESDVYFGLILGYIALLALICFIFAFKGRHLPDMYKNAKFITISMLISIVAWAVFVPIRLTITGKYLSATEASTILVCNYSVLVCHFCPKVYVILFNNEINIEKAISEHIRKHYENQEAPPGSM